MQRPRNISSIKVVLVQDDNLFRELTKRFLEHSGKFEVIGVATNGEEAVQLVRVRSPDVVVLDVNLSGIGPIELSRLIRRVDDSIRLVALSPNVDASLPLRLLEAGVGGFVTKACSPEEFLEAVKEVHHGRKFLDARVARDIVLDQASGRLSPLNSLTAREVEIMTWIAKGKRVSEIADALSRSPKTISTLRSRVFRKLDVHSDVEVALLAIRYRLVRVDFLC